MAELGGSLIFEVLGDEVHNGTRRAGSDAYRGGGGGSPCGKVCENKRQRPASPRARRAGPLGRLDKLVARKGVEPRPRPRGGDDAGQASGEESGHGPPWKRGSGEAGRALNPATPQRRAKSRVLQ